jgi:hypothetical protein
LAPLYAFYAGVATATTSRPRRAETGYDYTVDSPQAACTFDRKSVTTPILRFNQLILVEGSDKYLTTAYLPIALDK